MEPETLDLLQETNWSAIRKALLTYSTRRARNYCWNQGKSPDLAKGYTVEDVVQEVIVKTFEGVRKWDPEKGQLLPWLQLQSKSVMDALAKSASHRHEMSLSDLDIESLAIEQPPDLESVLPEEARADIRRKVEMLFRAVDDVPELREILQAILDGCSPRPRYLALELNISIREVDNRLKRLRRCASKLVYEDVLQSH
ncbi:MAG: sigma-70 family RNA polymerase sigma factor [Anaerolineaceae bacterium]|nr:sigma-70 family RNA polymerase sigma factor [Anaerolineaceae bacterium]